MLNVSQNFGFLILQNYLVVSPMQIEHVCQPGSKKIIERQDYENQTAYTLYLTNIY